MSVFKLAAVLCILIAASITDIRKRQFPTVYQVMLLLLIPIQFHMQYFMGAAVAVPFFVASLNGKSMGGGDWKAVGLLGLLMGFHSVLLAAAAGCICFIIYGKTAETVKGEGNKTFPFIPFLTIGYILVKILEVAFI